MLGFTTRDSCSPDRAANNTLFQQINYLANYKHTYPRAYIFIRKVKNLML